MQKYRFHFIFAGCFGVGVLLLCWLMFVLRASEVVQQPVAYANFIPVWLSAQSQRLYVYPHAPRAWFVLLVLVFVQWFAVGFGLSFLFRGRRVHDYAV
jgi:hypothetical protein